MKVHHVVPHFFPEIGGVETSVFGLARFQTNRGHEVVVHASRRTASGATLPQVDTRDGISIRRYWPKVRLGYYATLFRPDIRGADVVHLHGYGFLTNDRVARTVQGSLPFVYSLHHGVAQRAPSRLAQVRRTIYDPLVGWHTLRSASAIVAASEVDRRWLGERQFPVDRVCVLPTGLDSSAFVPGSPDKAKEKFATGDYIVFIGRLHREKSPDHVIRAVASLGTAWQGSVLFLGPDGGERKGLEDLAGKLGLADRVVFTGEVEELTKRDVIAGAACLVLPSFYEAQGIGLVEAWAQSRPVIASKVGGIPYIVEDGQDGLLYPYGDIPALARCIRRISADPGLASSIGVAGFNKAKEWFSWDRIGPRFEALYETIVRKQSLVTQLDNSDFRGGQI